jgi:ribonucleoside-triphosphate reductase
MKKSIYENASARDSYVSKIFKRGEKLVKNKVLKSINCEWSRLHSLGYIHIHDLDAYGLTYNCLTFNVLNKFPYSKMHNLSDIRKIMAIFDYFKEIISKIGNEQSGGMSFGNFDLDTATILKTLNVQKTETNLEILRSCISSLFYWCSTIHERMGQFSYYVTINIGLADSDLSRIICRMVIEEFEKAPFYVYKPNIVFKVKTGCNADLLTKALLCSAKKMIPTYLLCDSTPNKKYKAVDLAIMGCRTKVVQNEHGKATSIGRGNIGYITINLPRLAFEVVKENFDDKMQALKDKWLKIAANTKDILLDRYQRLIGLSTTDFPNNFAHELWITDFSKTKNLEDIFKNGTLSIGFIGLSEAMEIIHGEKFYMNSKKYKIAVDFVSFMREYINKLRVELKMNFTLLASSGEFISGRFSEIDSRIYEHAILEKNYYTNSFHIDVDSNCSAFKKIETEAPFHNLCNGGCISYVELKEAPIGNAEGLKELIDCAMQSGTNYLGFNFDKDVCKQCGEEGVFDKCDNCACEDIIRIRRVSGYLEILDYFTAGKQAEVKNRKKN